MCESEIAAWMPYPDHEILSPLMKTLDVSGMQCEDHACPACASTDRERHLWLYLAALGVLDDSVQRPILHIGPEPRFERRMRALGAVRYETLPVPADDAAGLEKLPFPDREFHLVICDHALEYAGDPVAAVRGLSRCLADDGWLVAQSVLSPRIRHTLEFTAPPTPAAAHLFFGEGRRRRLFGADMPQIFADAGLRGRLYSHSEILPRVDCRHWGCNPTEPLGLFSRTRWLESPS
jgi:SAM-dependent methyltransferase